MSFKRYFVKLEGSSGSLASDGYSSDGFLYNDHDSPSISIQAFEFYSNTAKSKNNCIRYTNNISNTFKKLGSSSTAIPSSPTKKQFTTASKLARAPVTKHKDQDKIQLKCQNRRICKDNCTKQQIFCDFNDTWYQNSIFTPPEIDPTFFNPPTGIIASSRDSGLYLPLIPCKINELFLCDLFDSVSINDPPKLDESLNSIIDLVYTVEPFEIEKNEWDPNGISIKNNEKIYYLHER
ncbi:hypothetical protein BB560_005001, partial [Smittium megazygosporum]